MKPGEAASDLLANSITRAPPPAPPNSRTTTSIASWHAFDVGASQHISLPFPLLHCRRQSQSTPGHK